MFITVRFGDDRQELFNPHSKVCVLLDNIKQRCDCNKEDVIDLSDPSGVRKNLHLNPMDYAIKHVDEREVLILIKIERFPGSLNESCVPLLDGLQGDKEFLRNINKDLNVEPNSEDEPGRGSFRGRRASMNLKKQRSTVIDGGKRGNRTRRSQSVAIGAGSTILLKSPRKGR